MPQRAYDLAVAAGPVPTTTPTTPTTPTTTTTPPSGGCAVTQRVVSSWPTGYTGEIVIENRGAPLDHWTLTFSAPGVTVTQGWNGTWTDTGDVVEAASTPWNGTLTTGGTVTIGYNANYGGGTPPFRSPTLNGRSCA
ncbi:cellulose binding domain-containing protein [Amycolatopsis sp. NBRC 101858]|uniref:cellulose binding domain-containing protein n=1 Tax=Amycolatopsis sp. NBRC 101858 TaxID=3032200 RepID=UPI0025577F18|nr:cellulose binding domain-containing protein [Amycolatopsis sp. NBRC 101858]